MTAAFLDYLRSRNMSPHTLRAYASDLRELTEVFPEPLKLRRLDIHGYLSRLHSRRLSSTTIRRKMAVIKSFLEWLQVEDVIPQNPMDGFQRIRIPDSLPEIPSESEICQLIEATLEPRDRAILELLYGTGCRNAELCGLDLDHFEGDRIILTGKGDKQRYAVFGVPAKEALSAWLRVRQHWCNRRGIETRALFISLSPNLGKCRLDVRNVNRIVHAAAKRAGLPELKYHPHLLRHCCATHMLERGCPIEIIGKLLGHSQLSTTTVYARVSPAKMLESFRKAHPHAS